ncbi:MAG: hypothetical protein EPO00_10970 [Chloroflexota bacterium]|nr:MAG: hypothetical protein EPO00_10970 [Chloroflexota bacterium]
MNLAEKMPEVVEDRDEAADAARHLAENSLVRVWSSFQRFAEAAYNATPTGLAKPAPHNAVQNLGKLTPSGAGPSARRTPKC